MNGKWSMSKITKLCVRGRSEICQKMIIYFFMRAVSGKSNKTTQMSMCERETKHVKKLKTYVRAGSGTYAINDEVFMRAGSGKLIRTIQISMCERELETLTNGCKTQCVRVK